GVQIMCFEEHLWDSGMKSRTGLDIDRHHFVAVAIKQLTAIARPTGRAAAVRGYQRFRDGWVRHNVDFIAPVRIGLERHPMSVRRETSHRLGELRFQKKLRSSFGGTVLRERQEPQVSFLGAAVSHSGSHYRFAIWRYRIRNEGRGLRCGPNRY